LKKSEERKDKAFDSSRTWTLPIFHWWRIFDSGIPISIRWVGIALVSCIEGSISPATIFTIYGRSLAKGDFLLERLIARLSRKDIENWIVGIKKQVRILSPPNHFLCIK